MNEIINEYKAYLDSECKSQQTSYSYFTNAKEYIKWYESSFGMKFEKLIRQNILEYVQYLKKVKRHKKKELSSKTINHKLSSLKKFNEYLIAAKFQDQQVIQSKDYLKVQTSYANPSQFDKQDVEQFKQKILLSDSTTAKRLYTMVIFLEKTGMRISELLNIKVADICMNSGELIIRNGKGNKQRTTYLSSTIIAAIKEYIKSNENDGEFLFASRQSGRVTRSVINKEFRKYSTKITPRDLRHFFCTNALEQGFGIHEVANLAGHNSAKTTLIYLNPSKKLMKEKMELL